MASTNGTLGRKCYYYKEHQERVNAHMDGAIAGKKLCTKDRGLFLLLPKLGGATTKERDKKKKKASLK